VNHRLSTDAVDKGLATNLVVRLQDVVNILDDVLLVAHRANRLRSMLEADDHSMATVMESVLLDVGSGLFLTTTKGQSIVEDAITKKLLTSVGDCH